MGKFEWRKWRAIRHSSRERRSGEVGQQKPCGAVWRHVLLEYSPLLNFCALNNSTWQGGRICQDNYQNNSRKDCSWKISFRFENMAPIPPEDQVNGFVVDESGELDFSDLEEQYSVSYEEGFDNVILVDNCPIVEEDTRKQKLIAFIRKIFSTNGTIKKDGIFMPMAHNPKTGKTESKG
jgi:hypothetical protein